MCWRVKLSLHDSLILTQQVACLLIINGLEVWIELITFVNKPTDMDIRNQGWLQNSDLSWRERVTFVSLHHNHERPPNSSFVAAKTFKNTKKRVHKFNLPQIRTEKTRLWADVFLNLRSQSYMVDHKLYSSCFYSGFDCINTHVCLVWRFSILTNKDFNHDPHFV